MNAALYQKSSGDYLKRISGSPSTHQVLVNYLTNEAKVVSIYSTRFNLRGSPWTKRFYESYSACENFKSRKDEKR